MVQRCSNAIDDWGIIQLVDVVPTTYKRFKANVSSWMALASVPWPARGSVSVANYWSRSDPVEWGLDIWMQFIKVVNDIILMHWIDCKSILDFSAGSIWNMWDFRRIFGGNHCWRQWPVTSQHTSRGGWKAEWFYGSRESSIMPKDKNDMPAGDWWI